MAIHLFTFLLQVAGRKHETDWLLSEIHRRIAQIRSESVVMSQEIPTYFELLSLSDLDSIITAAWIIQSRVSMNRLCLVELDVLGAALKFPGGQTRFALHVRRAIKDMGCANPWKDRASQASL